MKRFVVLVWLVMLSVGSQGWAQSPDEEYVRIYDVIQEAEALAERGALAEALPRYTEALATLQRFQKAYPLWNPEIVKFRLGYLQGKTSELTAKLQGIVPPSQPSPSPVPPVNTAPADWEQQIAAFKGQVQQLQADKALLEAKLKEALSAQPAAIDPRELAKAEEKARTLQKENELLNIALQREAKRPAESTSSKSQDTLAELTRQLTDQKEIVARLTLEKEALQNRLRSQPREAGGDTNVVASLRARLEALEAIAVPYTEEELALLDKANPQLGAVAPPRKASGKISRAGASLLAEAQRHAAAREFGKAEECYLRVLKEDEQNVPLLANLAEIQLLLNHLDDAEKHITEAVRLAPQDADALSTLGQLKSLQRKPAEAVEALSRAAQLDPQDANIQNRLGVALMEKGLRVPAETALRKAIQLQPNFADAHKNLAVVYLSQQPAMTELARWHYQKALAAGSPPNPGLEKMLEAAKTAGGR